MEKMLPHIYKHSKRTIAISIVLITIFMLASCVTYTYEDAKEIIPAVQSNTVKAYPLVVEPTKEDIQTLEALFISLPESFDESQIPSIVRTIEEQQNSLVFIYSPLSNLEEITSYLDFPTIVTDDSYLIASNFSIDEGEYSYRIVSIPITFSVASESQLSTYIDHEVNLLFTSVDSSQVPSPFFSTYLDIEALFRIDQENLSLFSSHLIPLEVEKVPSDTDCTCIKGTFILVD
jgi:hypothetical protein